MKRFYQKVGIGSDEDGHRILLDDRPLRTPAKRPLALPSVALAEAIAAEWRAQGERVDHQTMPLTRLASTASDRMPDLRPAAIAEAVGYGGTDLLCYRAPEPLELVQRQQRVWQPWLDWMASAYGVRLTVTTSLQPVSQPKAALGRLRGVVEACGDWQLVGLHAATAALGSLVLALALADRRINADQALAASLLDELFEIERWGSDAETEQRHAALRRDVRAAAAFLECLPPRPAPAATG